MPVSRIRIEFRPAEDQSLRIAHTHVGERPRDLVAHILSLAARLVRGPLRRISQRFQGVCRGQVRDEEVRRVELGETPAGQIDDPVGGEVAVERADPETSMRSARHRRVTMDRQRLHVEGQGRAFRWITNSAPPGPGGFGGAMSPTE
nr:hypothetical protein [Nocardia sputi]